MNWFYAIENTKVGPVDEATLKSLLRAGTISTDTLVWKEGMEDWQPYSSMFSPAGETNPGAQAEPVAAVGSAAPGRCAECGQSFPSDQLISLGGRQVCGVCKPVAVQKFQEGVVSFGATADADDLWQRLEQRGFDFTIGSVLSRSWKLVKGNFWPCVGITLLSYIIMMGANQIPILGLLSLFLVQPQIIAGLNWYFLKQFRGESATINDAFAGFRRGYGQQALYMLIIMAVMLGVGIVCAIPAAIVIPMLNGPKSQGMAIFGWAAIAVVGIAVVIAIWYFMISWIFTPLLILDKGLKATAAMALSRRVVGLRFWKLFGLLLVIGLLSMVSLLALIIGIIFVLPIFFAAISRVYEDAFGEGGPEAAN